MWRMYVIWFTSDLIYKSTLGHGSLKSTIGHTLNDLVKKKVIIKLPVIYMGLKIPNLRNQRMLWQENNMKSLNAKSDMPISKFLK